ncbi:MAG: ATP-dependent helicase, partial [Myxococcales bacterium]|nr:ATP-dependent helicase [Myxococcales bacterium]
MPTLAVTPSRTMVLHPTADAGALEEARARAIEEAFAKGPGFGLLHLAGPELNRELPVDLGFGRELGRRFLAALCRTGAVVDAPPDGFVALGAEAPPMLGAEYLDEAALEGAWAVMRDAAAEELAGQDDVLEYAASKNRSWHVVGRVVFHLAENQDDPDAPFAFLATYVDGVG